MMAVILAAGRGTRLGKLTQKTPKSLILVHGKPILEYTFSALPSSIKKVILVVGHLNKKIKKRFGNKFQDKKITYVQTELTGTGGAVWQVKSQLDQNRFLVLNGDDIYHKSELEKLIKYKGWSAGLAKTIPKGPKYLNFNIDKNGFLTGAEYPNKKGGEITISTGSFVVDSNLFKYKLVKITKTEYGLPQTFLKAIKKYSTKGIIMKNWIQINTPEDIKKAEKLLSKNSLFYSKFFPQSKLL